MAATLQYAVTDREVDTGATVLRNYAIKRAFVSDDACVVSREDPPREKVRLSPEFARLAPVVRDIVALMGEDKGCTSRLAVGAALRFLNKFGRNVRLPAVSGTEGGVQLEWFRDGRGVELEFDAEGDLIALTDVEGRVRSEVIDDYSDPFLQSALSAICDG